MNTDHELEESDCLIATDQATGFAEVQGWNDDGIHVAMGTETQAAAFKLPPGMAWSLACTILDALASRDKAANSQPPF